MKTSIIFILTFAVLNFSQAQSSSNESSATLENLTASIAQSSFEVPTKTVPALKKPSVVQQLTNHLSKTVNYPEVMLENEIEGTVWIKLTLSETGMITQSRIIESVSGAFDKEVRNAMDLFVQNEGNVPDSQIVRNVSVPVYFSLR